MNVYDTYGIKIEDIEQARVLVEEVLGVSLEPRYSSYMGGDYYKKDQFNKQDIEDIYVLQRNYCDHEGWTEEEYRDFAMILRVDESPNADEIRKSLLSKLQSYIVVIRRRVITDDRWYKEYRYVDGRDELLLERNLPPSLLPNQSI